MDYVEVFYYYRSSVSYCLSKYRDQRPVLLPLVNVYKDYVINPYLQGRIATGGAQFLCTYPGVSFYVYNDIWLSVRLIVVRYKGFIPGVVFCYKFTFLNGNEWFLYYNDPYLYFACCMQQRIVVWYGSRPDIYRNPREYYTGFYYSTLVRSTLTGVLGTG